jgi:parallel beta-helix repeat protein
MKVNKTIFLFSIFLLIAFLFTGCGMLPKPTKGAISGRILIPPAELSKDVSGWVPAANATVTIVDANGVTHTVTTDENGYYTFEGLSVKANTIITATVTIDGKTIVLKDVIPQAVAEDEDYDAGTMDPESTALALVVEKLIDEGVSPDEIDLAEIQASDDFTNLVEKVTEVLEEEGDVTEDPEVLELVEDVINPPAPPTPDTTRPRLVSLTAHLDSSGTREATLVDGQWTLSWTVGETVTNIEAVVSERVKLAVDPAQAVVTMSGEGKVPNTNESEIIQDAEYGTIAVDETDSTKLIITPKSGNETAGLVGTFTFTVAAGVVKDSAGNKNTKTTVTLIVGAPVYNKTQEKYYTTIQAAIDEANSDDIIQVAAGTYNENVEVNKKVTLQGEDKDKVIVTAASLDDHVFEVTANYVKISGFKVSNAGAGYKGIYLGDVDYCDISGNNVSNNGIGIFLCDSSYNNLSGNTISSNDVGIYLTNSSSNNTLSNNIILDTTLVGIYLCRSSHDNEITANTISSNDVGIWVELLSCLGNTVHCNKITGNTSYGVELDVNFSLDAECNWWGNPGGPGADASGEYPKGDTVDGFVDFDPWCTNEDCTDTGECVSCCTL